MLRSQRETSEGGGDGAAVSPAKAVILSQEEDAFQSVMDGEEPSNKDKLVGDNPHAWADDGGYDDDVDAKEGGSGLCQGMAKLEAAMAVLRLMAAWFAEQAWSTTTDEMATSYQAVVRLIVNNQAAALATALEFKASECTYLTVPNGEVFFGVPWPHLVGGSSRRES